MEYREILNSTYEIILKDSTNERTDGNGDSEDERKRQRVNKLKLLTLFHRESYINLHVTLEKVMYTN